MTTLHARRALLPGGWAAGAAIRSDAAGNIAEVTHDGRDGAAVVLPGIPNVHSHAFQRAMAGRAERAGSKQDSFWSWRERMYELCGRLGPEAIEAIARFVFVEMLEAGYTSVCEFHYLHHARSRTAPADPLDPGRALVRAANATGIRLTLLPVLYMHGGFGARAAEPAQARFVLSVHQYLALLDALHGDAGPTVRIGVAFHSLRAVTPEAIDEVLAWRARTDPHCPVHIHVAEQQREVDDCLAWSGRRPVQWLMERGYVDPSWCLVHATHMDAAEIRSLAATGAVAGLCPTTEANLGDGLFPLAEFLEAGGRIAVGSDSQVSVSPVEELRWLEYGQRLRHGMRNVAASVAEPHTGARLVRAALAGGRQALGQNVGAIAPGAAADFVELSAEDPSLAGAEGDELLDRFVFAGNRPLVANVMVAGRQVVRGGRHALAAEAAADFAAVMKSLPGAD